MSAPRYVLVGMNEYEECLAEVRAAHRRLREASEDRRADAQRDYDTALARARKLGARLARELDAAARA